MAYQQGKGVLGTGSDVDVTLDSGVTAGSLLVCAVSSWNAITGVSDDNGNSWSELYENNYDGSDYIAIWYAPNVNSGSTTVTVSVAASSWATAVVAEYSSMDTSPYDQNGTQDANVSSVATSAINVSGVDIFAAVCFDAPSKTCTPTGSLTQIFEQEDYAYMPINVCYQENVTSASYQATWTMNSTTQIGASASSWTRSGGTPSYPIPEALHHYRQMRT